MNAEQSLRCGKVVPVDFSLASFPEVVVGLGEVLAAKEPARGRQRGWVDRLQHTVLALNILQTLNHHTCIIIAYIQLLVAIDFFT